MFPVVFVAHQHFNVHCWVQYHGKIQKYRTVPGIYTLQEPHTLWFKKHIYIQI